MRMVRAPKINYHVEKYTYAYELVCSLARQRSDCKPSTRSCSRRMYGGNLEQQHAFKRFTKENRQKNKTAPKGNKTNQKIVSEVAGI